MTLFLYSFWLVLFQLLTAHCKNCEEPMVDFIYQPTMNFIQHDINAPSFSEDESKLLSSPDWSAAMDDSVSELTESDSPLLGFARALENSCLVQSGNSFSSHMDQVYNEIVYWRRNISSLPTGRARQIFVSELSHLFNAYYPGSSLERIALKAAMSFLILILQKPFYKSKSSDHIKCNEIRFKLWLCGRLTALLEKPALFNMD